MAEAPLAAVLGIDLGTQSTKAALVALDGRPLGSYAVPVAFSRPQPGWAEQPAEVLVASAALASRRVLTDAGPVEVRAVGVAAQMGGAIGIDASFNALTPHELWLDTRADTDRDALLSQFGSEIIAKNGIIPFVAPRVRRWRRELPSTFGELAKVVAPAGYLVGRLTGVAGSNAVCDRSQANLFGCFDVAANRWDEGLFARCRLPPDLLPRIVDPLEVIGGLSPEMADAFGLPAGTPISGGMGDGTGGWLAAGGVRPGVCIDTSGSSAHFAVTVGRFVPDPSGTLACMPSALPGLFYLLGFTTSTGLAHRWMAETFVKSYTELEALAAEVAPGSGGILAVPHLTGRVSPFEGAVKGAFVGFNDKTGCGALYRSLLEASAFELCGWLGVARSLVSELEPTSAVAVGGGANNRLWNQIKADVTGLAIRAAHSEVSAARGAALAAAIAVGAVPAPGGSWHDEAYLGTETVTPDGAAQRRYGPFREAYGALLEDLMPVFRRLQRLRTHQPTDQPTEETHDG